MEDDSNWVGGLNTLPSASWPLGPSFTSMEVLNVLEGIIIGGGASSEGSISF